MHSPSPTFSGALAKTTFSVGSTGDSCGKKVFFFVHSTSSKCSPGSFVKTKVDFSVDVLLTTFDLLN